MMTPKNVFRITTAFYGCYFASVELLIEKKSFNECWGEKNAGQIALT
jgi:hypothetical protein